MTDSTSSQTSRRRNRGGQDAKLARNLAAVQALNSSSVRYSGVGRKSSKRSGSPSRLKFLLSILLVTSLLLVILQTFRHLRSRSATSSSSFQSRLRRAQEALQAKQNGGMLAEPVAWKDRIANAASAVMEASASSTKDPIGSAAAIASQRENQIQENEEKSLNWKAYMAGMKAHFDEELSKVKQKSPEEFAKETSQKVKAKYAGGTSGDGMAVVPGEGVRDHEKSIPFEEQDLPAVDGKSDQEAKQDRKIALEDIDQETLKAMFDALYGRG